MLHLNLHFGGSHPCYLLCWCPEYGREWEWRRVPFKGLTTSARFTILLLLNVRPKAKFWFGITDWASCFLDIRISGVGRNSMEPGSGLPTPGAHRTSEWPSPGRSSHHRGTRAQHLGREHPEPLLLHEHARVRVVRRTLSVVGMLVI